MNNSQRDKVVTAKRLLKEVVDNCRPEIPLDLLDEIEIFLGRRVDIDKTHPGWKEKW